MVHNCPKGIQERAMVASVSNMAVEMCGGRVDHWDGCFTIVTRRRADLLRKNFGPVAGGVRGDGGSNRRVLTRNKAIENVTVSNRFGNLEEDLTSFELREEDIRPNDNKENENLVNQRSQAKSASKAKLVVFEAGVDEGSGGVREGSTEKRVGINKAMEKNGPKPKNSKGLEPTRGLIFGPTRGEVELSANGKVESGDGKYWEIKRLLHAGECICARRRRSCSVHIKNR